MRLKFDGTMTVCIFAWEERARESSIFNLEQIRARMGGSRPGLALPLPL